MSLDSGLGLGLRLDLRGMDGTDPGELGGRSSDPRSVVEVRFGSGDEPHELRLGGLPVPTVGGLSLDSDTKLWIWTGVGLAAVVGIVIAADAICIGVNTTSSKDKDDDDDEGGGE